ncbi:hypothetical protein VNO80_09539 [Phaseolus coccineus]|uniref:Secreted protein n=1 Tax=Phaseolus coccineus TaxID=3886 RepID=A0AAN9N872_PHACN
MPTSPILYWIAGFTIWLPSLVRTSHLQSMSFSAACNCAKVHAPLLPPPFHVTSTSSTVTNVYVECA